jgi:Xaa-Pro dipeptidase
VSAHEVRRGRLRERLGGLDVEMALITKPVNVRYLSGYTGSNGALLVGTDGRDLLATDGRYTEQAAQECPGLDVLLARQCAPALLEHRAGEGVSRAAYEAHHVTVEEHASLSGLGVDLVPLGWQVEDLRRVKDEDELAMLREACAIGDRALTDLVSWLRAGRTERAVARRLEELMLDHGGDGAGFDTIVAAGPNSSIPHHQPTDRPLQAGDFLKLDFGSLYRGYHADMTRMFVVGRSPADWQRDLYALVASAQAAGREAVADGAELAAVDGAARGVIEEAGLGDAFPHGLGHGVGLEIHEAPLLAATSPGTLVPGVPVTIEPGVYLAGRGGVRIEDTTVVTTGAPELLTTSTRELLVVG